VEYQKPEPGIEPGTEANRVTVELQSAQTAPQLMERMGIEPKYRLWQIFKKSRTATRGNDAG